MVALVTIGCADDRPSPAAPTTTAAVTETTAPRPDAFAVGRRTMQVVDPSRPTAADPGRDRDAEPDRTLELLLLYPAAGDAATAADPVDDAPVADGAFPVVVFAHGWTATGPVYETRIREWARAGYVVAAPTFPLSSGARGVLADYVNQPGDMSFVIDELLGLPGDDPLAGHIDAEAIAVAGHSLGAMTVLGLVLNSCCTDDRVDAAIEISGMRLRFGEGTWDLDATPFLAIHGTDDDIVPVEGSDSLFAEAPGPAAYLRLEGADHSTFLFREGQVVDDVVLAFLDRHLRGDANALEAVPDIVEDHGDATFEEKPAA